MLSLIIIHDGNDDDLPGGSINVKTNPEKFGGGSGRMVPFLNFGRVGVPPPSKNPAKMGSSIQPTKGLYHLEKHDRSWKFNAVLL